MSPDIPEHAPEPDLLNHLLVCVGSKSDRQAFAALFKHFAPRIKSYLMRSGSSESQAEEFAQEAMVNVWKKAAGFDPAEAAASTWIFAIARNLRIDHFRRLGNRMEQIASDPHEDALAGAEDPEPTPEEQLFGAQCERAVRSAMAALPPEQQLVLRLSFYEEHPHARIAAELGLPLGTVKSRVRLALNQLRRRLDGMQP
ncbi:sigma-70 family RNA polymerase sigma factor [Variovorax dokdonensis]|uniref:Sigma-70 family RNA polymerase sigma factor n=1 Tax=Variovorax dokdonensis TaxID=344883 RepID=A0ABT7N9A3_9BURK|nr:sigma-70 family RNA polymerase sigma factor [Variovorax dokdonensis]MDM0044499.1 sigma-70 family RNA polymerase sigma factor [Variovorax dokdonensis]